VNGDQLFFARLRVREAMAFLWEAGQYSLHAEAAELAGRLSLMVDLPSEELEPEPPAPRVA